MSTVPLPTVTLPKGFQYWLTVFEAPDYRVRTLAKTAEGGLAKDESGENYHATVTWDVWLAQEEKRMASHAAKTALVTRSDGQLALAVTT